MITLKEIKILIFHRFWGVLEGIRSQKFLLSFSLISICLRATRERTINDPSISNTPSVLEKAIFKKKINV